MRRVAGALLLVLGVGPLSPSPAIACNAIPYQDTSRPNKVTVGTEDLCTGERNPLITICYHTPTPQASAGVGVLGTSCQVGESGVRGNGNGTNRGTVYVLIGGTSVPLVTYCIGEPSQLGPLSATCWI